MTFQSKRLSFLETSVVSDVLIKEHQVVTTFFLRRLLAIMNTIEAFVFNFKNLEQMEKTLQTNDDCIAYLEELVWEGIPVSPFD